MSEKDKATTEKNNEQEGTSRAVFSMEQQEHLKSMMAAAVAEALTAHSSKDQRSQEDVNKTSKQNDANEHKGCAQFESRDTWHGSRLPQVGVRPLC